MKTIVKLSIIAAISLRIAFVATAGTVFSGCVNCPPNGTITTNTVTVSTNVLASATMGPNGTLVVIASVPSNQLNAVTSAIGTNPTPSTILLNPQ
jgi:hypothetical protein